MQNTTKMMTNRTRMIAIILRAVEHLKNIIGRTKRSIEVTNKNSPQLKSLNIIELDLAELVRAANCIPNTVIEKIKGPLVTYRNDIKNRNIDILRSKSIVEKTGVPQNYFSMLFSIISDGDAQFDSEADIVWNLFDRLAQLATTL